MVVHDESEDHHDLSPQLSDCALSIETFDSQSSVKEDQIPREIWGNPYSKWSDVNVMMRKSVKFSDDMHAHVAHAVTLVSQNLWMHPQKPPDIIRTYGYIQD